MRICTNYKKTKENSKCEMYGERDVVIYYDFNRTTLKNNFLGLTTQGFSFLQCKRKLLGD